MMRPYWVAWLDCSETAMDTRIPTWVTNERHRMISNIIVETEYLVMAAVMATSPEDAKQQIEDAYVDSVKLEWKLVEEQPLGWSPFTEMRPREPHTVWNQRPH